MHLTLEQLMNLVDGAHAGAAVSNGYPRGSTLGTYCQATTFVTMWVNYNTQYTRNIGSYVSPDCGYQPEYFYMPLKEVFKVSPGFATSGVFATLSEALDFYVTNQDSVTTAVVGNKTAETAYSSSSYEVHGGTRSITFEVAQTNIQSGITTIVPMSISVALYAPYGMRMHNKATGEMITKDQVTVVGIENVELRPAPDKDGLVYPGSNTGTFYYRPGTLDASVLAMGNGEIRTICGFGRTYNLTKLTNSDGISLIQISTPDTGVAICNPYSEPFIRFF